MTCAIMTRFYRAPEAILTEEYDKSVDLWSVGVILAELIMASQTKSNPKGSDNLSIFMFPGGSCYPQSPCYENSETVNMGDQIFKILEKFPDCDKDECFSFISQDNTKNFVEQV